MITPTLTIGQLAAHVGVTTRAIRHYHACGLLPEPDRGASGYRRYDAQAVVDLLRIKTLAQAGVPLARIGQLLRASPEEFVSAVSSIDRALETRIGDLQDHRRRLGELAHGDRLFLSDDIAALLDELRSMGVSERTVRIERDGWIVVSALSTDLVAEWVEQKRDALADPEFRRLYLACDEAFEWDPDDPRLSDVAALLAEWSSSHPHTDGETDPAGGDMSALVELMAADVGIASPAWKRLGEMVSDQDP
jgi:DNA-binding transcriptional MerR regulator